jgi:hypothetical protein
MSPAVRAYLQRFKADLPRVAFFVTSGNTNASKIVPAMETILGHGAEAFVGFTAAELADQSVYNDRIATFLEALREKADASGAPVVVSVC